MMKYTRVWIYTRVRDQFTSVYTNKLYIITLTVVLFVKTVNNIGDQLDR